MPDLYLFYGINYMYVYSLLTADSGGSNPTDRSGNIITAINDYYIH